MISIKLLESKHQSEILLVYNEINIAYLISCRNIDWDLAVENYKVFVTYNKSAMDLIEWFE